MAISRQVKIGGGIGAAVLADAEGLVEGLGDTDNDTLAERLGETDTDGEIEVAPVPSGECVNSLNLHDTVSLSSVSHASSIWSPSMRQNFKTG